MPFDLEQKYIDQLIFNVINGNVCLFLGAGSSLGGTNGEGDNIAIGDKLATLLISYASLSSTVYRPLNQVYDAAINKKWL